jgi:hypothetical protein
MKRLMVLSNGSQAVIANVQRNLVDDFDKRHPTKMLNRAERFISDSMGSSSRQSEESLTLSDAR